MDFSLIKNVMYFYQLPATGRALICTCARTVFGPYPPLKTDYKTCKRCNKPRIHLLWECDVCDQYFIKNFRHPGFCISDPKCWDCLAHDDVCISCVDRIPALRTWAMVIIPPPVAEPNQYAEVPFDELRF